MSNSKLADNNMKIMLVKVNRISDSGDRVVVTKLDIDDFGSVIPLEDIELLLPENDPSVLQTLKNTHHAAIFTESDREEQGSTIVLARAMTEDDLNKEKERTIEKVAEKKAKST